MTTKDPKDKTQAAKDAEKLAEAAGHGDPPADETPDAGPGEGDQGEDESGGATHDPE